MKLENFRIGTRLTIGFAAMFALLVLMLCVGERGMFAVAADSRQMMAVPLAKERLAEEWYRNVAVGIRRTLAIVKSSDPGIEAMFAAEAKQSLERNDVLLKTLQAMPTSDEERKLLAAVNTMRHAYRVSRDEIAKDKREGRADEANKRVEGQFATLAADYAKAMERYVDFQRSSIDAYAARMQADTKQAAIQLGAIGAVALVLAALLARVLTRSIAQPLLRATELANAVAAGDLSQRITSEGRDEVAQLRRSLGAMTDSLRQIVGSVRQSTDSIGTASAEIASGNQDLSNRTEQAASNLQQTASSMAQLTGTVTQTAESARQANQLASDAASVATRGGQMVQQVVQTMQDIDASSKKIAAIIGTIDGIAFQTNILALNAAVEAARAGEQGRGFAVVASEVRSLAQRSAEAAREIKALIGASVERVESGSRLVNNAGSTMGELVASVQRVSDIIGEISSSAGEQSQDIGQVNSAVAQLDHMTQQNAALVEQSAAAAGSLKDQAQRLGGLVGSFKLQPA